MTWEHVSLANANQPEDYTIIILEAGDRISQVTSKYNRGDIIITTPICLFEYSFPLQGFVRDFLRYYNLSHAQIHPNRCIILSLFKKLLRIIARRKTPRGVLALAMAVFLSIIGIDFVGSRHLVFN